MFTVVDMWCLLFYLVPLLDLQSSALCPNRVWLKLNSFFCKIPFFFARPRTFNAVNTLMITSLTININTIIVGFWWVLMVCFLMLIVITTWYQQYLLSWILLYYSCLVSTMPLLFSADVIKEYQKHPSRGVLRKRYFENMQQIYRRTAMPKCDFTKVALQPYWNRTSAWVFFCKFAAYFQSTFSQEHLWMAASGVPSFIFTALASIPFVVDFI